MGIFDALFSKAKPTAEPIKMPEKHELFWNKLQEKTGRKQKFAAIPYTLLDGTVISYDEDTKVGFEGEIDGEFEPLHAGTYDLADGTTLRVESTMPQMGDMAAEVSAELATAPAEPQKKFASYVLDDGRKIEIGMDGEPVMIDGAAAAEGLYTTSDGLQISVDAGGLLVQAMSAATFESFKKELEKFSIEKNAEVEKLKAELEAAKSLVEKQNIEVIKLSAQTVRPTNNTQTNSKIADLVAQSQKY